MGTILFFNLQRTDTLRYFFVLDNSFLYLVMGRVNRRGGRHGLSPIIHTVSATAPKVLWTTASWCDFMSFRRKTWKVNYSKKEFMHLVSNIGPVLLILPQVTNKRNPQVIRTNAKTHRSKRTKMSPPYYQA